MGLAMTALRHQPGRRVVLVFTDGKNEPVNFRGPKPKFKDIVKRAEHEDVMVYAIGLASSPVFVSPPRGSTSAKRDERRGSGC